MSEYTVSEEIEAIEYRIAKYTEFIEGHEESIEAIKLKRIIAEQRLAELND